MEAQRVQPLFSCVACPKGRNDHDPRRCLRLRTAYLAHQFPTLKQAPGILPFDAPTLARWVRRGGACHGALVAGKFILSVWNPSEWNKDKRTRFDLHEALGVWDETHREAFRGWVDAPWWP